MAVRLLKEFDLFRKLAPEHQKAPSSGPAWAVRYLCLVLIQVLLLSECVTYLVPKHKQSFDIDMQGPMQLASPRQMRVMLDVTVHDFPCIDLSLDYQDAMGNRQTDIRSGVVKQRLKPDGTPVGDVLKNDPKTGSNSASNPSIRNGTGNATCGDCYGALPEGECCNTCSDVLYAYRLKRWALPRIESIRQCQQDGTAKSAYQPPQIAHLKDYSSDDYFNTFRKIGSLSSPDGNEARITAPLKLNLSLNLQNITFKPLNLKPLSSMDDDWDDWDYDYDFDDWYHPSGRKEKNKTLSWPECVRRNVVVNGYNMGEALMEDLVPFGAKEGCWKDNCSHTDKFNIDTMDHCATVCSQVTGCSWWTWGVEDFAAKCWLRSGKHGKSKRYGFASGTRNCTVALKTATTTSAPASSSQPNQSSEAPARRLSSLDDFSRFELPLGSMLHMPMFEWDKESEQRREQKGESCRIHGHFDLNRVPGNFHIGTHGATLPSYLNFYDDPAPPQQNMRHTIHSLTFVDVSAPDGMSHPLDGFESPKAFTFQYYLMITPVTRQSASGDAYGYQYKAASFVTNELIGPAVFFRMEIDPIRVVYYTERVPTSKFIVNVCAVVGGCIAISSMLLQILDAMNE